MLPIVIWYCSVAYTLVLKCAVISSVLKSFFQYHKHCAVMMDRYATHLIQLVGLKLYKSINLFPDGSWIFHQMNVNVSLFTSHMFYSSLSVLGQVRSPWEGWYACCYWSLVMLLNQLPSGRCYVLVWHLFLAVVQKLLTNGWCYALTVFNKPGINVCIIPTSGCVSMSSYKIWAFLWWHCSFPVVNQVFPNIGRFLRVVLKNEQLSQEAESLRVRFDTLLGKLERMSRPMREDAPLTRPASFSGSKLYHLRSE